MIVVNMDLHSAVTHQKSSLVKIKIWNDGTGTLARGNYQWNIFSRNGRLMKTGELKNWPRNSKTALALLQKVINVSYPQGAK